MGKVSELVSQNVADAITNYQTWGGIMKNVKSYGAKGSGESDDTALVQRAINDAINDGMKAVFFPSGVYAVTSLTGLESVVLFGDNAAFSGINAVITQLGATPLTGMPSNPIINGNFDVQTQGTSITNLGGLEYLAERWLNVFINDGGILPTSIISSIGRLTGEEIPGSQYFYRISPNGAGSGFGAEQRHCIIQFIEGATAALAGTGKQITLSFYARSSIANKRIGVNLHQAYGTGGSPYENIYGRNWTLTPTWKKYSFTWKTNTLNGKTMAKDNCLAFQLWWVWGDYYKARFGSSTSESYVGAGNIDFAQVQVNSGDAALPYQPKPFNEELAATKRYYQKSYSESVVPGSVGAEGSVGVMVSDNVNTKYVTPSVPFMVEMLKPPTIRIWDTAGNGGATPKITTRDAADLSLGFDVAPAGENGGLQNIGTTGFKLKHQGAIAGITFQWDARCELPLS